MPNRHARLLHQWTSRLVGIGVAVLIGGLCAAATSAVGKDKAPSVLGIALGESTINDAVYVLGSPKAVYLAGEDSEGSGRSVSDPLVLRYETAFELRRKHRCHARLFLDPRSYVVKVVSISFSDGKTPGASRVSKSDIEAVYGREYRTIHRRLEYNDGGMEARVGSCDDPRGEVESLLYPKLGLEVWIEDEAYVRSLSFSFDIWSGVETIKPCPSSK